MKPFHYERSSDISSACAVAARPASKFVAGGTNLIDLMKLEIETPAQIVDINALPLDGIEETTEQGLRIGALVTNSALAADMNVRQISTLVAGNSGRRVRAAPQQGDDGRQSASAYALSILL